MAFSSEELIDRCDRARAAARRLAPVERVQKDAALTVHWSDGRVSIYPIAYLRRMSPSAEAKQLREEMRKNPLTVLPGTTGSGPIRADSAELVGHYALRIRFSDGHDTGIYSWGYLREIDPALTRGGEGG